MCHYFSVKIRVIQNVPFTFLLLQQWPDEKETAGARPTKWIFTCVALTTIWYDVLCNFNIYILNFEIVIAAVDDLGHYQSSFLLWASHNYLNGWRGFLKLIQLNRNSCLKEFLPKFNSNLHLQSFCHTGGFWWLQIDNQVSGKWAVFWKQIITTEKG